MAVLDVYEGAHALFTRDLVPGSNQAAVFVIGIIFSIIGISVMALRVHCRVNVIGCGLATDDYLMFLAVVSNVGLLAANMVCAWYGAGVHVQYVPLENYPSLLKSNYANRLLYVFSIAFVKLSILSFYLRIDPRKPTRYAIYFLMFTVVGLSIATASICVFECYPPRLFWDTVNRKPEQCMEGARRQTFFEANGVINIVQDVWMWLIPVPMLWKLQMPMRQKLGLIFIFCIGLIAVVAGGIRYYYVLKLANEQDIWYYFADSLNWCSIEVYAAIICGSASTFRTLVKTYMPRMWGSRYNRSGKAHPYNGSNTGQFAMGPYGSKGRDEHVSGNKDQSTRNKKGIVVSKEISTKVSDADASSREYVAPYSQV